MSDLLVDGAGRGPLAGQRGRRLEDDRREEDRLPRRGRAAREARPGPGKIAGSIYIPYNQILTAESLAKLPKDKKLILACVTGQTQNLPVLALRALGYDAWTMKFGMTSWIKGYLGAKIMQDAIAGADYPVEPVGAAPAAAPPSPGARPGEGPGRGRLRQLAVRHGQGVEGGRRSAGARASLPLLRRGLLPLRRGRAGRAEASRTTGT